MKKIKFIKLLFVTFLGFSMEIGSNPSEMESTKSNKSERSEFKTPPMPPRELVLPRIKRRRISKRSVPVEEVLTMECNDSEASGDREMDDFFNRFVSEDNILNQSPVSILAERESLIDMTIPESSEDVVRPLLYRFVGRPLFANISMRENNIQSLENDIIERQSFDNMSTPERPRDVIRPSVDGFVGRPLFANIPIRENDIQSLENDLIERQSLDNISTSKALENDIQSPGSEFDESQLFADVITPENKPTSLTNYLSEKRDSNNIKRKKSRFILNNKVRRCLFGDTKEPIPYFRNLYINEDLSLEQTFLNAIYNGSIDVVISILSNLSNSDEVIKLVNCNSNYRRTPLMIAFLNRDVELVKILLEYGANVHCLNNSSLTNK